MKFWKTPICAAVLLVLGGCVSSGESPLIFGQTNTFGVSIGGSVGEQGADLTLGYKGQNIAVVPVTMAQPGGRSEHMGAVIGKHSEAYSVLGHFESRNRGGTSQNAVLGTFFATGLASKRLADGFAYKLGQHKWDDHCQPVPAPQAPATTAADAQIKQIRMELAQLAHNMTAESRRLMEELRRLQGPITPPTAPAQSENKSNTALVYTQYQSLGFSVGAAGTQQGADLTLGFKERNFTIIPSFFRDANGVATPLHANAGSDKDGLSVLGQFEFQGGNENGALTAGLGKFFSTGAAARRLGDGFAAKLCSQYEAPQTPVK